MPLSLSAWPWLEKNPPVELIKAEVDGGVDRALGVRASCLGVLLVAVLRHQHENCRVGPPSPKEPRLKV